MENIGISPLDLIVLGVLIFGALTGLVTGFVRGGLFLLSWAGAIIITIYSFSSIAIYSRKYIENELFADIAGGAIIFLLSLVILHLISQMLSNWIRSGSLNVIDRSFGLLAGIVITALALAVINLFVFNESWKTSPPDWAKDSRSRPVIDSASLLIRDLLPSSILGSTNEGLKEIRSRTKSIEETKTAIDRLSKPPKLLSTPKKQGYSEPMRQELDNLIQKNN
ncbi:MAG: CvpA family protein [Alphaproteobacteria bacterium]|nr:CvpA family protein [Alphaproteobacteria bacterium]|tara:strand:- start:206 stop:874 length:669 start_codon:yes stop_codon:yes gene_type:complete